MKVLSWAVVFITIILFNISPTPCSILQSHVPDQRIIIKNLMLDYMEKYSGKRIPELADAILDSGRGDIDVAFLLVAIAHQETHFRSRKGRAGERGYFQVMPWVAHSMYPGLTRKQVIHLLETDLLFQADTARAIILDHYNRLKTWPKALFAYNRSQRYVKSVLLKKHLMMFLFTTKKDLTSSIGYGNISV